MSRQNPIAFSIITSPKPVEELIRIYGELELEDMTAKQRETPEKIEAARAEYRESLIKRGYKDPVAGTIVGIGYVGGEKAEMTVERGDEATLLNNFWKRLSDPNESLIGWGVIERDLQWIKARGWANGIQIPAGAIRPGGAGRASWNRIHDLQRDFTGAPTSVDKHKVACALNQIPTRLTEKEYQDFARGAQDDELLLSSLDSTLLIRRAMNGEFGPTKGNHLSDEEVERIAREYLQPPGSNDESGYHLPVTWDIETAPGDLEFLKRVFGEFDPKSVKTGNLSDPVKIAEKIRLASVNYEKDMLDESQKDPYLGRISAVGIKLAGREPLILDHSEHDQVRIFWKLRELSKGQWKGWNIFGFDIQWMKIKSYIHGLGEPSKLRRPSQTGYDRWERFIDLMVEWTGSPKLFQGLHTAALALGLEGKNGNGADFYKLFESRDPAEHQKGVEYLERDLNQEEGVGNAMGFGPDLELIKKDMSEISSADVLEARLKSKQRELRELEFG